MQTKRIEVEIDVQEIIGDLNVEEVLDFYGNNDDFLDNIGYEEIVDWLGRNISLLDPQGIKELIVKLVEHGM